MAVVYGTSTLPSGHLLYLQRFGFAVLRLFRAGMAREPVSTVLSPDTGARAAGTSPVAGISRYADSVRYEVLTWAMSDSMKPSERYRRDAQLLLDFRSAFIALVNDARHESDGFAVKLVSNTANATWQAKRKAVAVAAGAADLAYQAHGGIYMIRTIAYVKNGVSPVTNWEMALRDPEEFPPESVIASVDAAFGAAASLADDAARRERGFVGLIAAFLRWPSNLREAVGNDHAVQATAAGAVGIVGQIVVATVASALAAGVVACVVRLWQFVV